MNITIILKDEEDERVAHHKVADALDAAGVQWDRIESNWEKDEERVKLNCRIGRIRT